jgi:preprotein translocase subunit YajC
VHPSPALLAWRAGCAPQDTQRQWQPRQDQGAGGPGATGAGETRQQAPPGGMGDCYSQLWIFLPMILIFYFLLLRPQQKQEKLRREMLGKLEKGDRVVTSGGIHGTIASITNDIVVLKIDPKGEVKLTMDRSAIARVVRDEEKKPA